MKEQDLTSILSHEFGGYARKLSGLAELLEPDEVATQLQHEAKNMQDGVERLVRYLRLAAEPVVDGSIPLHELVAPAFEAALAKHGLEGTLSLEGSGVAAVSERHATDVVDELIDNAVKFSPNGVVVQVRFTEDGGHLAMQVQDGGLGFSPEKCEAVFHPMHKQHSRNQFRGPGMGLAIVRAVAERYGGSTSCKTARGEGSIFNVTLPLAVQ